MTRNPMLPMYCDWTLEDGDDCLMLAVAVMTTETREHWTCMPHARAFYAWLRDDFGDGAPTITPIYRGDSHEAAAAERACKLAHWGEPSSVLETLRGPAPMVEYLKAHGHNATLVRNERDVEVAHLKFADGSTLEINDFDSGDWEYELANGDDSYGGSIGITSRDIVELVDYESEQRGGPARG